MHQMHQTAHRGDRSEQRDAEGRAQTLMVGVSWPNDWSRAYFTPVTLIGDRARLGTTFSTVRTGLIRDIDLADRGDDLLRQGLAEPLATLGAHEHQVLLQEDRAVKARGQHEVAFAQGPCGAEFVEDVVVGHERCV